MANYLFILKSSMISSKSCWSNRVSLCIRGISIKSLMLLSYKWWWNPLATLSLHSSRAMWSVPKLIGSFLNMLRGNWSRTIIMASISIASFLFNATFPSALSFYISPNYDYIIESNFMSFPNHYE